MNKIVKNSLLGAAVATTIIFGSFAANAAGLKLGSVLNFKPQKVAKYSAKQQELAKKLRELRAQLRNATAKCDMGKCSQADKDNIKSIQAQITSLIDLALKNGLSTNEVNQVLADVQQETATASINNTTNAQVPTITNTTVKDAQSGYNGI